MLLQQTIPQSQWFEAKLHPAALTWNLLLAGWLCNCLLGGDSVDDPALAPGYLPIKGSHTYILRGRNMLENHVLKRVFSPSAQTQPLFYWIGSVMRSHHIERKLEVAALMLKHRRLTQCVMNLWHQPCHIVPTFFQIYSASWFLWTCPRLTVLFIHSAHSLQTPTRHFWWVNLSLDMLSHLVRPLLQHYPPWNLSSPFWKNCSF